MQGSLRATNTIYTNTAQFSILSAPTTAGGATYGPGTNGNVLSTNGTTIYWRGVTDNSSSTEITNTDTNLITGRTLYYAGYVKSSGVTSVQVQASSPLQSSTNTAQNSFLNTTISFINQAHNTFLAGPASPSAANAAPTFRILTADDIPTLTPSKVGLGNVSNSTYAGGTAITLNGSDKSSSTASFYAPTDAGAVGQFLRSTAGTPEWKNIIHSDVQPILSKDYAAYTISDNDTDNGTVFFGNVTITNTTTWQVPWAIHYRVYISTTEDATQGWYDCYFTVNGSTVTYYNYNNFYSTSYYPIYQHALLYPKEGKTAFGAHFGVRISDARNATSLARTIRVEIIETINCTVTLRDSITKYSALYNSTNFYYQGFNATTQGLAESGDSDNGQYYLRYWNILAKTAITSGNIITGASDGYQHLKSGAAFDITYPVLYAGSNINAAATGNNNYIFHYSIGISTTQSLTLTVNQPIYIKGTLSGSIFTPISMAPLTQTVPTSADDYYYYYIGEAYSTSSIIFDTTARAIYSFKNGKFGVIINATEYATTSASCTGNAANVTGTIAIDHGGTGTTTTPTQGGIIYAASQAAYASTGAGTAGQVLISNGANAPAWFDGLTLSGSDANSYTLAFEGTTGSSSKTTGAVTISGGLGVAENIYGDKVHGAVWNDYAEYRKQLYKIEPGRVVYDLDNGCVLQTEKRLMPGAQVVSDTFGFSIGETEENKTPLAVSGRVLVYTYRNRSEYHAGDAVCSAPNGTIDIMTREEIKEYPDAIIGIVSEIPNYTIWGEGQVPVNERIWIKVR